MLAAKRAASSRNEDARICSVAPQNTIRALEQSDKIYRPNKNSVCSVRLKQNLKNSASVQLTLRIVLTRQAAVQRASEYHLKP